MWTRRKKIIFVAATYLALVALLTVSFIYAGSLLVVEVPPQRADVGLVLAGHFGRALYAADLYHQGFIPRIWISRPEREKYLVQLDSIGVPYPRQEEISRAVLLKKGVPDDRIEVIGDGMVSTIAEARFVAGLLEKQPEIHSLLLITSRFHVRRAQAIFDRVVVSAFPVHILTVGSPYDGFIADQWWKDRDSAREVLLETAKLLLFWTKEEF
ncbi:MAG: YdcF family protein [Nitrospiraceae bacterium]